MKLVEIKEIQQFNSKDTDEFEGKTHECSKPYNAPVLKPLGKLSTVTLGGSPGIGDSGNPGGEQPPG